MCSMLRLAVLVAIVGCVELITVKTPQKYMNVEVGQEALLKCTFETSEASTDDLQFVWDFAASGTANATQMYYYMGGNSRTADNYKDRLVPPSSPGPSRDVSVVLRNMQVEDSGLYTCDVRNFPDVYGTNEVVIKVNVLLEPSKPYCSIHGTAHVGNNATLVCHSQHGSPAPTYTWSRIGQSDTTTRTGGLNTGTMEFRNITESDFGSYHCTSQNMAGSSACELEFYAGATDVGKLDSQDIGYIAAIVLGVLLGCVLIGVTIWLIVQAVNKKKYKGVRQTEGTAMSTTNP